MARGTRRTIDVNGPALRKYREEAALSQTELAQLLDPLKDPPNNSYICRLETGSAPRIRRFRYFKIVKILRDRTELTEAELAQLLQINDENALAAPSVDDQPLAA
ncbi:MAG: hypothetical protein ACREQ5_03990 [Candidatus Dormibacteria bacterium]